MCTKSLVSTAWLMGLVLVNGCSGGPAAPVGSATVQMTVNPAAVAPATCPPSHCGTLADQLEVQATLTVRETAGVSMTIARITMTLRRRSDNGAIASGEISEARGARVSANGLATFPVAVHFDVPSAERNMKVVIALEGNDDNSHPMAATIELEVNM